MTDNIIAVKKRSLNTLDKKPEILAKQEEEHKPKKIARQDAEVQTDPIEPVIKEVQVQVHVPVPVEVPVPVPAEPVEVDYDRIIKAMHNAVEEQFLKLFKINIFSSIIDVVTDTVATEDIDAVVAEEVKDEVKEETAEVKEETATEETAEVKAEVNVEAEEVTEEVKVEAEEVKEESAEKIKEEVKAETPPEATTEETAESEVKEAEEDAEVKEAEEAKAESFEEGMNDYFQATMILDVTGTGAGLTEAHSLNIQNCFLISPDLPDDCPPAKRILYFLHSAIEIAKEHQFTTFNIITNHLRTHKNFIQIMSLAIPVLKRNTEWQLVHYCCNSVTYPPQALQLDRFDWQKYCTLNPDLPDIIKSTKARSIQDWCARGHKTGRFANIELLPSTSNNTLAFALRLKLTDYDELLTTLEHAFNASTFQIFDNITNKYMLAPNLFIVPGTGAAIMKQLRWLPEHYLEA